MLRARALVVVPLAALLAIGAIRAMTFVAPSSHPLRGLAPAFGEHPVALTNRAMAEIGTAAAQGRSVPPLAREAIANVARKAPLTPTSFLVEGTIAEMAGDSSRAERLFLAARFRDPRSQGVRYFLADRYLKTKRVLPGLIETAALARLSERASQPLIPALAAYASTPYGLAELRRFFRLSPDLRDRTLALLAQDAGNAPLVLALAPQPLSSAAKANWPERLIGAMVATGDYSGAHAVWSRIAGVADRELLFNSEFRPSLAPPPFNWQFASGPSGVAEASGSGGLDVIYYGRDDVSLATQLVRLAPGRYRLSMRIVGQSPTSGLAWDVQCVPANDRLLRLPLGSAGRGATTGTFGVPAAGCPAQRLELRGQPGESPQTTQLTIFDLKLEPLVAAS